MTTECRSEPLADTGGHVEGAVTLSSHLSLASLIVRESVQNSWDARDALRQGKPVKWAADGRTLTFDEMKALRPFLPRAELGGFSSGDDETVGLLQPSSVVGNDRRQLDVLIISDRRTVGLCGPSRSGRAWQAVRFGEPWDDGMQRFAYFIRNTGRRRTDIGRGAGGSFGVGKTVLWRASRCGTVVVHTRTTDEQGEPVDRAMGVVHGQAFDDDTLQFTGRHFVGRPAEDSQTLIEPVTGADATDLVSALELLPHDSPGFGTSIIIIAPRFVGDGLSAMNRIRDAVRWQVWPKYTRGLKQDRADMEVSASWQGQDIPIADPDEDYEIAPYAGALREAVLGRARRSSGDITLDHEVKCGNPKRHLGWVRLREETRENALHESFGSASSEDASADAVVDPESEVEPPVPFETPFGHVALIRRAPLLLVKYLDVPGSDDAAKASYVGVFLSADDPAVESALTSAEPPAHDDWLHEQVQVEHRSDYRRRFAKRAVEEIRAALQRFGKGLRPPAPMGGAQQVSAVISRGLLRGGRGGRHRSRSRSGSGGGGGPTVTLRPLTTRTRDGVTTHRLEAVVNGLTGSVRLTASVAGRDSAGSVNVSEHVQLHWEGRQGSDSRDVLDTQLGSGGVVPTDLIIIADTQLRLRPHLKVESIEDA